MVANLTQTLVVCSSLLLLLLLINTTTAAKLPPSQNSEKKGNNVLVTSPVNCQPVPHDTLWLRLDVEPTTDRDEEDEAVAAPEGVVDTVLAVLGDDTGVSTTTTAQSAPHRRRHGRGGGKRVRRHSPLEDQQRQTRGTSEGVGVGEKPVAHNQRRQQATKLTQPDAELVLRKTSWQCQMETVWKQMPEGTFPPRVQMGRCTQSKCMLGMYECVAKKYAMKILRRVDTHCNPVPLVSGTSTYEEAWVMEDLQV